MRKSNGYTLIEIMVAIAILGTSFIGLTQAFPFALKIVKTAENKTKASYLAQEKIEELYQAGYAGIATGTIEIKHRLGAGSELYNFQRETVVETIDQDLQISVSDLGMKKITTTVFFTDSITKQERAFAVSTILTNRN